MSPRGRIYNLTITDPVDVELVDADLELTPVAGDGKRYFHGVGSEL